jgi:transposase InsO family protein
MPPIRSGLPMARWSPGCGWSTSALERFSRVAFSPQGYFTQVPAGAVQDELRQCFARWGMPLSVRVDNGNPWGSCGELATPLALWLIGLGVGVIWNPPRRPQDNGVVERSQGVASNWAEPHRCRDVAELQRRLDEEDQVQRACYPHGGFGSRLEAYPGVAHSGRPYSAAWEGANWSWERVLASLADVMMPRRVDQCGKIGLYHGKLYVGTINRGKEVVVQFDAERTEWVISDPGGVELCRRPLTQFDAKGLSNLINKWYFLQN